MSSEMALAACAEPPSRAVAESRAEAGKRPADDLVVRAREGDAAAFEALLTRHQQAVFSIAWRLLGSVEDAQDAAQEVFLRLYRSLDTVDPVRPLGAWLHRVTVNVCHDLGRQRRSRQVLPLHESDAETRLADSDPASDPAARAAYEEERGMILEGLATLTPKERAALVLRDLEGLSTVEVARALEAAETTVRTHICRGRQKLKKFRDRWLRRSQP